jgi:hypothetical protein
MSTTEATAAEQTEPGNIDVDFDLLIAARNELARLDKALGDHVIDNRLVSYSAMRIGRCVEACDAGRDGLTNVLISLSSYSDVKGADEAIDRMNRPVEPSQPNSNEVTDALRDLDEPEPFDGGDGSEPGPAGGTLPDVVSDQERERIAAIRDEAQNGGDAA